MQRIGSTFEARHQNGFTLIEVLIVTVIIGILAAIAIPKFSKTKEKAYVAAMKSDLRNLVMAEEMYFADNFTYGSIANLGTAFAASTGVTVATSAVTASGWSASSTHTGTAQTCTLALGAAAGTGAAGVPACS